MVALQGQPASHAHTQSEPLLAHTVMIYNQAAACPGAAPLSCDPAAATNVPRVSSKSLMAIPLPRPVPALISSPGQPPPGQLCLWMSPSHVLCQGQCCWCRVQGRHSTAWSQHGTAWSRHMCSLAGQQCAKPWSSWGGGTVPSLRTSPLPARREPREQCTPRSLQPQVSGKQRQSGSAGSSGQPAQLWSPMPAAVPLPPLGTSHLPRGAARGAGVLTPPQHPRRPPRCSSKLQSLSGQYVLQAVQAVQAGSAGRQAASAIP